MQVTVLCDGWLTIALDEWHSRVFTIVAGIWEAVSLKDSWVYQRFAVSAAAHSAWSWE